MNIFSFQGRTFSGHSASASEFIKQPQDFLNTVRFQDACIEIGSQRIFITTENRFEELVIDGGHSLEWLLEPSKFPHHDIMFTTNEEELLSLTANWCGWIFDDTNCPYVVLDSWLYWRLTNSSKNCGNIGCQPVFHNTIMGRQAETGVEKRQHRSADVISLKDWRHGKTQP